MADLQAQAPADADSRQASADQSADKEAVQARLEQLKVTIRQVQSQLDAAQGRKDLLIEQLRQTEQEIGRIGQRLRELDLQIAETSGRVLALEDERESLAAGLADLKNQLARQLRAAYMAGPPNFAQRLLTPDSGRQLQRNLGYWQYLTQAPLASVQSINDSLARLDRVRNDIVERRESLEALRSRQVTEQRLRVENLTVRREVVAALEQQIAEGDRRLTSLGRDESDLEQLLEALEQALADIPPDVAALASPRSQRGQLPWPVPGRIIAAFGSDLPGGGRQTGVVLAGEPGTMVEAAFYGRVAFADWLRGYGLLIIVDHGDGIMTLYGRNNSLFAEVGDWVEPRQPIAALGSTGGQSAPGLYFEVRVEGRAVDPVGWMEAR